jgi:hypothetical protein
LARKPAAASPCSAAHAERLRHVARRHSLSEIARRTGLPVSCIHSYLNGTRIPAELFTGLVEHFGVNPVWLHTGQGPVYSSDIAPETATMAEDVLKLVESMEAVGKMRMGAMSGNQPRVRALDDALKRHEQLQRSLSERAAVIMKKLLDDAERAISARDYGVAEASLATAARLQKLCLDPTLTVRRMNTEAISARLRGNLARALTGFREAFLNVLPVRAAVGSEAHAVAFNYSNALQLSGELREAIAVADGMLVLGEPGDSPDRAILEAQRAWLDVLNGELHTGLSRMAQILPRVPEKRRPRVETPRYMIAQMYAGVLSFDAALQSPDESPNKGAFLTFLMLCFEDIDQLGMLYDRYFGAPAGHIEDAKGRMGSDTSIGRYMTALIRARREGKPDALPDYEGHVTSLAPDIEPVHRFSALVNICQLTRLCGQTARARRRFKDADQYLAAMPAAMTPDFLDLARHHHNAMELAARAPEGKANVARAKTWFSEMIGRGYLCFRPIAG